MKPTALEKLHDTWMPLVLHILDKHFSWATYDTGTGGFYKIRRALNRDDLKQEGFLGLIEAWERYDQNHDSGSSFKTYAYRVIYNRLLNYIDLNTTPITTSRSWQERAEPTQEKLEMAIRYMNFSEIFYKKRQQGFDGYECFIHPTVDSETDDIDQKDFNEYCIAKLKANLDPELWRILMLRFDRYTLKEIAEMVSLSTTMVRQKLHALNFQIHHILYREIEEFGHDHSNQSIMDNTRASSQVSNLVV